MRSGGKRELAIRETRFHQFVHRLESVSRPFSIRANIPGAKKERTPDGILIEKTVRTPINAVNNYIEMAIENTADDRTRQILGRAQEASTSLVDVMEDLMRLTKIEDSPSQEISDETFNLNLTGLLFYHYLH